MPDYGPVLFVDDEAPIVIALAANVPCRHDQPVDTPPKCRVGSLGELFEQLRAALLAGSMTFGSDIMRAPGSMSRRPVRSGVLHQVIVTAADGKNQRRR